MSSQLHQIGAKRPKDALARAIDDLGATDLGNGHYAFFNDGTFRRYDKNRGFYDAYEDKRWHTFSSVRMERISERTEALKLEGQALMPSWWTPAQQFATGPGRQAFTSFAAADHYGEGATVYTADLETGEEVPA